MPTRTRSPGNLSSRPATPDDRSDAGGLVLVPGHRQRLGDQLYGQILEQIVSGRLKEGDRLPSEKSLCQMFGVSRPVVRDALLRLRADGLLHARQGSGTFILRQPTDRLTDFADTSDIAAFLRTVEIRLPIEAAAAKLAAERRTAGQLARIETAHDAFHQEVRAGSMTAQTDIEFHTAIAFATGNDLFPAMFGHLHQALAGFMSLSLSLTRTGPLERARQVLSEHTYVLEAIQKQEPDAADVAMRFHIGQARRRMFDRALDK